MQRGLERVHSPLLQRYEHRLVQPPVLTGRSRALLSAVIKHRPRHSHHRLQLLLQLQQAELKCQLGEEYNSVGPCLIIPGKKAPVAELLWPAERIQALDVLQSYDFSSTIFQVNIQEGASKLQKVLHGCLSRKVRGYRVKLGGWKT